MSTGMVEHLIDWIESCMETESETEEGGNEMFEVKEDSHVIVKRQDIGLYLNIVEQKRFFALIDTIVYGRKDDNKPVNNYLVVNCDESYANEVFGIIAKNHFKTGRGK